jgi:hypothetical protein
LIIQHFFFIFSILEPRSSSLDSRFRRGFHLGRLMLGKQQSMAKTTRKLAKHQVRGSLKLCWDEPVLAIPQAQGPPVVTSPHPQAAQVVECSHVPPPALDLVFKVEGLGFRV